MEDQNFPQIQEKFLEALLEIAKDNCVTSCICSNLSISNNYLKKVKRFHVLSGWKPDVEDVHSPLSRSNCKKNSSLSHQTGSLKSKASRLWWSNVVKNHQKCYFENHTNRAQHIQKYRMEFSTVKLVSNTDGDPLDPYMLEKGTKG